MASFICSETKRQSVKLNSEWKINCGGRSSTSAYPVEHICPALHRDALENRQNGKEDIVEVGDPAVGTLPLAPALGRIVETKASAAGKRTRWRVVLHHEAWAQNNNQEVSLHTHEKMNY